MAQLYWEAFGRKLGPALGPPERGRDFLAAHLHRDRAVVALDAGRVVGVAGYHLAGRALTAGDASDVLTAYGILRGLPRLVLLALLDRRPADGQLLMDGIAVDPDWRGRGLGSRLLHEVAAVAVAHSCREVRLDVVDTNPGARRLYERHGFVPVRTAGTPYLRQLMGFGAVVTMHRSVAVPTQPR
ncbi:GNAT family N-acetyltransferase [Micromonospora sp. WMMA1363]|uniref:GNAT family N-acetyltransferase n=1 Tax=Micromonospora sp. WMMA1363 TaxID=3053985 RepID=UPI00259D313E|nr:GNAT family N-acetyltransferase [Micromonospora sp. WMMA1363]MDM4720374.1 GNAT family N-acetyltransferase [Micromonospora sp. WMMA1363]